MKTKLEELKAAYEDSYGLSAADKDTMELRAIRFYDAAHNLMPTLLEAVELLEEVGNASDMAELTNLWEYKIEPLLEKLK